MTVLRLLKIICTKLYLMHRPKPYCVQLLIYVIQIIEPMKNLVTERHLNKIEEYVYKTMIKDELDIVQVFERLGIYANLKTISNYAKDNKLSYNGVKKHRNIIELFGCKFVLDNE